MLSTANHEPATERMRRHHRHLRQKSGEITWILAQGNQACTDACANITSTCVEDVWPNSEDASKAIAELVGVECNAWQSLGSSNYWKYPGPMKYVNHQGVVTCYWYDYSDTEYAKAQCGLQSEPNFVIERMCPCQGSTLAAKGDPHLQNMFGQRFDLMMPGIHTLINIPRGEPEHKVKLRITADAQRVKEDATCGELYFQALNMTGDWIDQRGPLYFRAGHAHYNGEAKWMTIGQVDVKVVHGVTLAGIAYLNLMIRHLRTSGFAIGGLLGEDSHDLQATPSSQCSKTISLLSEDINRDEHARSHWVALAE